MQNAFIMSGDEQVKSWLLEYHPVKGYTMPYLKVYYTIHYISLYSTGSQRILNLVFAVVSCDPESEIGKIRFLTGGIDRRYGER